MVPNAHVRTLEAIKKAFEDAGIEFVGTPKEGAGVRWKPKQSDLKFLRSMHGLQSLPIPIELTYSFNNLTSSVGIIDKAIWLSGWFDSVNVPAPVTITLDNAATQHIRKHNNKRHNVLITQGKRSFLSILNVRLSLSLNQKKPLVCCSRCSVDLESDEYVYSASSLA